MGKCAIIAMNKRSGMIILMGLAGSGKSTQGQKLAEATGRVWLSAGQVLRDTNDPELKAIMDRGELVDDRITIRIMVEKILEVVRSGKDLVIDGFPRDIEQAEFMAENLAGVMKLVIIIEVPKAELMQRLELRGRTDDTRESIEERFRIVEQNIYSICEILGGKGIKIRRVDGMGTPEEVSERIMQIVTEVENE